MDDVDGNKFRRAQQSINQISLKLTIGNWTTIPKKELQRAGIPIQVQESLITKGANSDGSHGSNRGYTLNMVHSSPK